MQHDGKLDLVIDLRNVGEDRRGERALRSFPLRRPLGRRLPLRGRHRPLRHIEGRVMKLPVAAGGSPLVGVEGDATRRREGAVGTGATELGMGR